MPIRVVPRDPLGAFSGRTLLANAVIFTRALRSAGLATDLGGALDFGRALGLVDVGDREQVRAAGAAIFCRRHAELMTYEQVFDAFWRRHEARIQAPPGMSAPGGPDADANTGEGDGPGDRAADPGGAASSPDRPRLGDGDGARQAGPDAWLVAPRAWSDEEAVRHREFDRMTDAELREAARLIDLLRPRLATRLTRRSDLHAHGRRLAPRAMLRRNLATGGDLVDWLWRRPVRRPRSLVLLCDVSGSMERHARLLLRFAQALARTSGVRTEAFVFGTHLTRITNELRGHDPDAALHRVTETVADWSGGTRIGEAFRTFNIRWARRVLRSSGVVLVVSDGWDRGEASLVGTETARLQRSCHRLVWLNPLAGDEGWLPLAAGMIAAYPYIDDLLPMASVASLERLGEVLGGLGLGSAGRPPRTGTPRVYVEAPRTGRLVARRAIPPRASRPPALAVAAADPGAARPLGARRA